VRFEEIEEDDDTATEGADYRMLSTRELVVLAYRGDQDAVEELHRRSEKKKEN